MRVLAWTVDPLSNTRQPTFADANPIGVGGATYSNSRQVGITKCTILNRLIRCLACPTAQDKQLFSFVSGLILPKPSTWCSVDQGLWSKLRFLPGAVKLTLSQRAVQRSFVTRWQSIAFGRHARTSVLLGRYARHTRFRFLF